MFYNIFLFQLYINIKCIFTLKFRYKLITLMNKSTLSGLLASNFQQLINGKETCLCILTNKAGCEVTVLNYGAKIVSIMVPDRNGAFRDVVAGHSSIGDYLSSEEPYFGAICGRYSNRIAKGSFTLDGVVYDQLAINNGPNSLHGGTNGFNAVVWDMNQLDDQTVQLSYHSADGEEGYPGNVDTHVTYHLSDNNELFITYKAVTDKPTVLNLTNHSFFNLSGAGDPSIEDHMLVLHADYYLPVDETAIPYGPKEKVDGTPMDFRTPYAIGERINDDFEQLLFGKGYDHTYILNKDKNDFSYGAHCRSPKSGIVMETFTTEPGIQLYTGNWLSDRIVGKNKERYPMRSSFCLETQHFPDSPNKPDYPSTILRPDNPFESTTVYKFSTK